MQDFVCCFPFAILFLYLQQQQKLQNLPPWAAADVATPLIWPCTNMNEENNKLLIKSQFDVPQCVETGSFAQFSMYSHFVHFFK